LSEEQGLSLDKKEKMMFESILKWSIFVPYFFIKNVVASGQNTPAAMFKAGAAIIWFVLVVASVVREPVAAVVLACIFLFCWLISQAGGKGDANHVRGTQVFTSLLGKKKTDDQLKIGDVTIPTVIESLHFLIAGGTGSGKSQAINSFLKTLRERGDKVLVVDSGGEAMARLFRDGDALLNPLDSRSKSWSAFAEMRASYESDRVAEMMVPASNGGSSREWELYSQSLISAVVQRLHERGEGTNERLVHYLTIEKSDEIEKLVKGLSAQTLMDSGAAKMLSSVRGIIGSYLPAYRFLNPETGGDGFSIRKWVQDEDDQSWLWIPYRDDQLSSLRGLISCWVGEAVNSTLSLRPSPTRKLWIVCDELASLGRIAGLTDGLTKGRKYGLRVVAGLQSVSQLRDVFGKEESQTLLSCLSNLLCLRAADGETSEYFSKGFGQQEFTRIDTSENDNGKTKSLKYVTQSTILASQISGLAPRFGYVRLASDPSYIYSTQVPICDLGVEVFEPFVSK
jgi:type IV secretory pathway TraG/TraD family ATPase VirD4